MTEGKADNVLIAVTGKGGVGKTTLAALVIHRLIRGNRRPVLAVDADPNMCLNLALGVGVEKTVGGVREEAREAAGKGLATGVATGLRPDTLHTLLHETRQDLGPIFQNALPIQMTEALDISNAVLFLISDEARHVTGLEFKVDAGATIR